MKHCNKCNTDKDIIYFWIETRSKDGRRSTCKICHKKVQDEWELKNKDKRQKQAIIWEQENKDKRQKQWKEYKQKHLHISRARDKYKYDNDEDFRKRKINQVKNRDIIKNNTSNWTITKDSLNKLLLLQDVKCNHCNCCLITNKKHLDHIRPISKLWKHILSNVQYLCSKCNNTKWNRFIW